MANVISYFGGVFSSRLEAEKDLRHNVKHSLKAAGLSRSYGPGKELWESLYKAKKGCGVGVLRAAEASIQQAITNAKNPAQVPVEAEEVEVTAEELAALGVLKASLVQEITLLKEMRADVQGNGKAAKEERENLNKQIKKAMKRLAETNG